MPCCSQNFVSRDVPQSVDGGERAAGTVRGYKLVSQFRFAGNNAINLIINMHLIHKVLSDVVQKFMQIRVIVVDVACIWRMVAIFLQYGKCDTAVDTQRVDGHKTLVTSFLLHDTELSVLEVFW